VLNGAEGLSELASGLVAQGLTIFDAIRKGLNSEEAPSASDQTASDAARRAVESAQSQDGESAD
jgi:flotillin